MLTFMLVLLLGVGVGTAVVMLAVRDDESTGLQQTNDDRIRPPKSAPAAPQDHSCATAELVAAASSTGDELTWSTEGGGDLPEAGRRRRGIPDEQVAVEGSFAEVAAASLGRRVRSTISLVLIAVVTGTVIAGAMGVLALIAGALLDRAV